MLSQPVSDGPHETPDLVEDGIPFISVDAIVDNKIDFNRKRGYITEEYDLECRKKYSPQRDDVYLVKSGATVGKVAIVDTDERFNIWSPLAAMRANKELMLPKYLYFYLQLKDVQDEIYEKSIGGTQPNLSMRILEQFNIRVPHIDEQKLISDSLSNLDNLITLHQCKHYQGHSSIFEPQSASDMASFTATWEQRKLREIAQITMGQSPDGSTYSETPSDYILVQGNADLKDGWVSPRIWTTQKTKTADAGDLIMSVRAPAGAMGKTAYNVVLGRGVAGIKGNEFLYQALVKMDNEGYWKKLAAGSTFESINSDSVNNAVVSTPQDIEEQTKIGDCLQGIDNLITLHQCKHYQDHSSVFAPQNASDMTSFTATWEQRKFAQVFIGLQNNTLSRADLNYESGTIKNVHYGDVLINFGEYIDVSSANIPYISDDSKADKYSKSFLNDGDIVIADTAEDETVGKCTEICGSDGIDVLSGLHTIPCRPIEKYGSKYLGYYMNSPAYHDQLKPLMQGIKVTSISKSALQDTVISCPKSIEEQTQIGAFLSNLDTIITLHQCKHYQGHSSIFAPQKASDIALFTATWEQRKLGDIMNITSVKRIHQSDWTDEGVRFLRARDIVAAAKGEEPSDYLYISQEKYEEYSSISGKVAVEDLLVTGVGTIGVPYLVRSTAPLYFKDGNVIWFQNNNQINGEFFYYSFWGCQIQSFIHDSAGIGTVGTYTIDSGKKTPIYLPSQEEQRQIGLFMTSIDNLITLHQRDYLQ